MLPEPLSPLEIHLCKEYESTVTNTMEATSITGNLPNSDRGEPDASE